MGEGIHIVKYGPHQQDTVMFPDGICRCICAGHHNNTSCYLRVVDKSGRVRKMTTKEIGRLMGVKDCDIDRMCSAGISPSNINTMFGNSIVVNVMVGIFESLFCGKTDPERTALF